jgi:hypothetical protein
MAAHFVEMLQDRTPYDEQHYRKQLAKRKSPYASSAQLSKK